MLETLGSLVSDGPALFWVWLGCGVLALLFATWWVISPEEDCQHCEPLKVQNTAEYGVHAGKPTFRIWSGLIDSDFITAPKLLVTKDEVLTRRDAQRRWSWDFDQELNS